MRKKVSTKADREANEIQLKNWYTQAEQWYSQALDCLALLPAVLPRPPAPPSFDHSSSSPLATYDTSTRQEQHFDDAIANGPARHFDQVWQIRIQTADLCDEGGAEQYCQYNTFGYTWSLDKHLLRAIQPGDDP